MMRRRLASTTQRLAWREWLLLTAVLTLLALGLGWQNGLGRADQSLYDLALSQNNRPARDDIIIVAIDDYSISQLGRWPWPRTLHAQLVERLNQAAPRRIGLDIILSEAEHSAASDVATDRAATSAGDLALAAALQRNGRSVLPVIEANTGSGPVMLPPIAPLACAAAQLGHINLRLDADGVVRSFIRYTDGRRGSQTTRWPHFALALAASPEPSAARPDGCATTAAPGTSWRPIPTVPAAPAATARIPFAGGSGHFKSVPYVAVLRDEVPAQFFTDKYVLVGATAAGMADSYPTPVAGLNGAMPGVEIAANILASVLDQRTISNAAAWQTALFSSIPPLLALLGYLLLSPRLALLCNLLLVLATLLISTLLLHAGWWLPPAAALTVLLLSYPLWSWRRLEAAIAYLGQEFMRLEREPQLLPDSGQPGADDGAPLQDLLERRIRAMANAARRVRDLRQFVSDSLNSFPDTALVTAVDGRILLLNHHAREYLAALGLAPTNPGLLPQLFALLSAAQPLNQRGGHRFCWFELLDRQRVATLTDGVSAQDPHGRDLLIKSAPCYSATHELIGWIISLIDVSTMRAAERSRDETLRFLSHDMRAPQASILALLELQSEPAAALPQAEFFARIEKASRKTLGLADNFVQLARAESQEYRLEEVNFQDLVLDATDEMWSLAKSRQIQLQTDLDEVELPVCVDRALLTRALSNLLSNAINYSPPATQITCSAARVAATDGHPETLICHVRDQGYGIAAIDQLKLFQRFQRMRVPGQPRHDGIGLGLVFVKTVIERHGGRISVASSEGSGTTFTIRLPLVAADTAA